MTRVALPDAPAQNDAAGPMAWATSVIDSAALVPARLPGRAGRLTENSLTLRADLTEAEWLQAGRTLAATERGSSWWVADWALYGAGREWLRKDVAAAIGKTPSALYKAVSIARTFPPLTRRNMLGFAYHQEAAPLGTEAGLEWLERAEAEGWSREELRARIGRARLTAELDAGPVVFPAGPFDVVYADPPWDIDGPGHPTVRNITSHYPVMALEDIRAMPVAAMAADDAVLYLWAPPTRLPIALDVMAAWGFTYRDQLVWVKSKPGLGWWTRHRHEPLLIGTRGKVKPPPPAGRADSVVTAPTGRHSAKPADVYGLIERAYPRVNRVELFARAPRAGWTAHGNDPALRAGRTE